MTLAAIFATDLAGGFGFKNSLPWDKCPEDMKHFAEVTKQYKNMIMGRNTAEHLPPLAGRTKWVVSSQQLDNVDGHLDYSSLLNAGTFLHGIVIGGPGLLLPEVLDQCSEVYHTMIKSVHECDVRISPLTFAWLGLRQHTAEVLLDTPRCTIRKFTNAKR